MSGFRWDGDERGEGVGDATAYAAGALELVDAMRRPNWVAEEPEAHLLPHVEQACRDLPFEIESTGTPGDSSFDIRLRWTGETGGVGHVRAAVFALVGSFAESATYVRQRRPAQADDGALVYEVVTGSLGDASFAPHGHSVRITVLPAR